MSNSKCSKFTKEEEVFIVRKFAILQSSTLVRRAFVNEFAGPRPKRSRIQLSKIDLKSFRRVNERFKKYGVQTGHASHSEHVRGVDKTDPEKVETIREHFIEFPMNSIAQASRELDIPKTTINRILTEKLKVKPYKIGLSQVLTEAHKEQRLEFCQWLVEQTDETISQIIFRNEKWFQLSQHPNRQNVRYWSVSKPNFVFDVKNQFVSKIMLFVIVVDGRARLFWHVDEDGKNISVNTDQYIKSVEAVLEDLPLSVRDKVQNVYIWQQDGASCHTSKKSMTFLKAIFKDRIISRWAKIEGLPEWPAHSPDLNPLDFSFWGQAMAKVWEAKPKNLADLKAVVELFFENLSPDFINKCVRNIRKRAELCVRENGDHFEHFM